MKETDEGCKMQNATNEKRGFQEFVGSTSITISHSQKSYHHTNIDASDDTV